MMKTLLNKNVSVIGAGITGFYTSIFLIKNGANVHISDIKPAEMLNKEYLLKLEKLGCSIHAGGYDEDAIMNSDLIVISPGVPPDLDILNKARNKGIPVIGEIELAYRFCKYPIIAITGTNGKSTVTSMLADVLKKAGIKVFVGGNIGTPFISCLIEKKMWDFVLLEISSFQLDTTYTFSPFISIILNITADHLDRYKSFEDYIKSKFRIFKNQTPSDYLILNDDDKILSELNPAFVKTLRFGKEKKDGRVAFLENDKIKVCFDGIEWSYSIKEIPLIGEHNFLNVMAVIVASMILGIEKEVIQKAIKGFKPLPHRLEPVLEKDGVLFIDDSKATNIDSVIKAVNSISGPVILIAGGKDKGLDYSLLAKGIRERLKHAILIGESAPVMYKVFSKFGISSEVAGDMKEAVLKASLKAKKGDTVLLSPACSSFDMFKDYSHRGMVFREAVRSIISEKDTTTI